jgi:hypothetical protein
MDARKWAQLTIRRFCQLNKCREEEVWLWARFLLVEPETYDLREIVFLVSGGPRRAVTWPRRHLIGSDAWHVQRPDDVLPKLIERFEPTRSFYTFQGESRP